MGILSGIAKLPGGIRRRIRRQNDPLGYARMIGVKVGQGCRFAPGISFGSEPYLITIGDRVSITAGVVFLPHDGGVWCIRPEHPKADVFGPITVGNNVFIGTRAILLPGVTVGDDCVIGAGSIVTKDIPAGSVAAGSPARVLGPIENYREKCRARALHTKGMSRAELQAHLEAHFAAQPTPPAGEQAPVADAP